MTNLDFYIQLYLIELVLLLNFWVLFSHLSIMTTVLTNSNNAKEYRNTLAKKINRQRIFTNNTLTKVFIRKTPEKLLEEQKGTPKYTESKNITREDHKKEKAEMTRQEHMKVVKKWLAERVMYYSKDGNIPLEEIRKDFSWKSIAWDTSFQIAEMIDDENVLKNIDNFSEEEKELLLEIANSTGEKGLKFLSILAKQGNSVAEWYINTLLLTAVEKIKSFDPEIKYKNDWYGISHAAITWVGYTVDDIIKKWCLDYLKKLIKNTKYESFVILALANWWVAPTEEQIEKINRYRDDNNIIVNTLLHKWHFKEAFLLNTKNTGDKEEGCWKFKNIRDRYIKSLYSWKITGDEFITRIVEHDWWPIVLKEAVKLELKATQEKKLIQQMALLRPQDLVWETLERASLMYPWIIWQNLDTAKHTLSPEDQKLLSLKDLQALISPDTESTKELYHILHEKKDIEAKVTYLLDSWYFSAAINIFIDPEYIKTNLSPKTITRVLDKVLDWTIHPFSFDALTMRRNPESYWPLFSRDYKEIPYTVATFFECIHQLTDQQISSIQPLLDKVIMENDFTDTFIRNCFLGGREQSTLFSYLSRLIKWRLIGEWSLQKLRKNSITLSNHEDYNIQRGVLFEEQNITKNPTPEDHIWEWLSKRLGSISIDNEAKKVLLNNVKITTTTDYRGEKIPALLFFWKKISFLTYHTQNSNICYQKDWRCYINKDNAQEIAKVQGKKLLDNITLPAEYCNDNERDIKIWWVNIYPEDIRKLLGEYEPYCDVNYRINGKTKVGRWSSVHEQFLPIVVYE